MAATANRIYMKADSFIMPTRTLPAVGVIQNGGIIVSIIIITE
jgi:hypothetical protein